MPRGVACLTISERKKIFIVSVDLVFRMKYTRIGVPPPPPPPIQIFQFAIVVPPVYRFFVLLIITGYESLRLMEFGVVNISR